jgi:uncharacterized membrane protein required for colicin V production
MGFTINWLDVLIILGLNAGMFVGFWQGTLRQLLAVGAIYVSLVVSSRVYSIFSAYILQLSPHMLSTVADVIAFGVLLFAMGLVLSLLLLDLLRDFTLRRVSGFSRITGAGVGLFAAFIIITVSLVALSFMTVSIWPASSEPYRQVFLDARNHSNLVQSFRLFWQPLLASVRVWGGVLPSIFSVDIAP